MATVIILFFIWRKMEYFTRPYRKMGSNAVYHRPVDFDLSFRPSKKVP